MGKPSEYSARKILISSAISVTLQKPSQLLGHTEWTQLAGMASAGHRSQGGDSAQVHLLPACCCCFPGHSSHEGRGNKGQHRARPEVAPEAKSFVLEEKGLVLWLRGLQTYGLSNMGPKAKVTRPQRGHQGDITLGNEGRATGQVPCA